MNSIFQKVKPTSSLYMSVNEFNISYKEAVKYFGKPHNINVKNKKMKYDVDCEWQYTLFNDVKIVLSCNSVDEILDYNRENSNDEKKKVPPLEEAKILSITGDRITVEHIVGPILESIFGNLGKGYGSREYKSIIQIIFEDE